MVDTPSVMFLKSTPLQSAQALSNTEKAMLMKITVSFLYCCIKNIPAELPRKPERLLQAVIVVYSLPCIGLFILPTELCTEPSDLNLVTAIIYTHTSVGLEPIFLDLIFSPPEAENQPLSQS